MRASLGPAPLLTSSYLACSCERVEHSPIAAHYSAFLVNSQPASQHQHQSSSLSPYRFLLQLPHRPLSLGCFSSVLSFHPHLLSISHRISSNLPFPFYLLLFHPSIFILHFSPTHVQLPFPSYLTSLFCLVFHHLFRPTMRFFDQSFSSSPVLVLPAQHPHQVCTSSHLRTQ